MFTVYHDLMSLIFQKGLQDIRSDILQILCFDMPQRTSTHYKVTSRHNL